MAALLLMFTGIANAQAVMTNEGSEYTGAVMKGAMDEGNAKFECDPCDYNVDYGMKGRVEKPEKEGAVMEGAAKIKCDPCDYNVDYGGKNRTANQ